MENFKNLSESFFREIRKIEIYKADSALYENSLIGIFPKNDTILYAFDIIAEGFSQKINRKNENGNYIHSIDISFPLLMIDKESITKYQNYFNTRDFAIVLISNFEKTLIGNNREALKIEILDNTKNNNSGEDEYYMSITGNTIISDVRITI